MYLTNQAQLTDVLERRREQREIIRQRLDEYAMRCYGLSQYGERIERNFVTSTNDKPSGILARQVASIMVEDVTMFLGCQILGLSPLAVQFARDVFVSGNADKLHRVKIPWISYSVKKNLVLKHERIVDEGNHSLELRSFASMIATGGESLLAWHATKRRAVFGDRYPIADCSQFWSECVVAARRKPEFVYELLASGHERRVDYSVATGRHGLIRPPSKWYYPLYLAMFLDGTWVLLETYENPAGGVPHAKRLFEAAMREVERETGFRPLVVETPPLTKDMMYYNKHLLQEPINEDALLTQAAHIPSLVSMFNCLADGVRSHGLSSNVSCAVM